MSILLHTNGQTPEPLYQWVRVVTEDGVKEQASTFLAVLDSDIEKWKLKKNK